MKQLTNNSIKNDLALAYRMCDKLGLSDLTYTHLSARSCASNTFYIYPFGQLFDEVQPDELLQVDFYGKVLEGKEAQYNKTGYVIHGSVYKYRNDVQAIFHLHTPSIVAVSCYKEGLLPLSQWALHFYDIIAYHNYDSLALDPEKDGLKIKEDLGNKSLLMMRHHGALIVGKTIQECLFFAYHLEKACYTQCLMGLNHQLTPCTISDDLAHKTHLELLSFEHKLGSRDFNALKRQLLNKKRATINLYS